MLKALVIKELRESAGIVALAVLAAVFAVANLTGLSLIPIFSSGGARGIPFVSDSFGFYLTLIAGGLALVLGLKQSAWEFGHNTYYFLLHRPVRRDAVFWAKLALGCTLVFVLGGLMILVYAMWAGAPGKSPTPFDWSMTASAWQLLLCLGVVYLSAFLCGIRPARWFGTRLAPAVCGAVVVMLIYNAPWWWLFAVTIVAASSVLLTAIFYYIRRRDY